MVSLKSDVLVKLVEEMKTNGDESESEDRKPVLLQIRSIIPVLEEGHLWPNRGFFLKISDSSHALYVSLPQEQNEMILGNHLKLGQFIYVRKLENAHPVPLLRGLTPVPGQRQCHGTPQDIFPPPSSVNILDASSGVVDCIVEKGVISEETVSNCSSPPLIPDHDQSLRKRNERLKGGNRGRLRSLSPSATRSRHDRTDKSSVCSADNDSDTDNNVSSMLSAHHISKRRSWNESEIMGVKDIYDSSSAKHRPSTRSRSANVSPVRSMRYESSDENLSSTAGRRRSSHVGTGKRVVKNPDKGQTCVKPTRADSLYDGKGAESGISWNMLPSSLVKLGKEVIKQRDIAMLAAADALQESCIAERLLSSLSTLSELPLTGGEEDMEPYAEKLFHLQDHLARTRVIMQSVTSISPLRTPDSECCVTSSIKETLSIALERKKNAAAWIRWAVSLDLSPATSGSISSPSAPTNASKMSSWWSTKPMKKSKGNGLIPLVSASDKDDEQEWRKGRGLLAASDMAVCLHEESRRLFLSNVEAYLDEMEKKYENKMGAGMMRKMKKVSEWLEGDAGKDAETCGRLRSKILGMLLKNVERTAMAFDS